MLRAWLPALGYMGLIWTLSSCSHPPSLATVPFHDKGAHFLEYGALAVLLTHAVRGTWPGLRIPTAYVLALLTAVLWGGLDEIHQAFVPNRVADAKDLLADSLGALGGALLYFAVIEPLRKRWPRAQTTRVDKDGV